MADKRSDTELGGALDRLWRVIGSRRGADPQTSYTARLFARGRTKIAQKLGEEAVEAVIEGVRGDAPKLVGESADLLYHLLGAVGRRGRIAGRRRRRIGAPRRRLRPRRKARPRQGLSMLDGGEPLAQFRD